LCCYARTEEAFLHRRMPRLFAALALDGAPRRLEQGCGDLPVQQSTNIDLIINTKTAKARAPAEPLGERRCLSWASIPSFSASMAAGVVGAGAPSAFAVSPAHRQTSTSLFRTGWQSL
jgi:hypothetical protein